MSKLVHETAVKKLAKEARKRRAPHSPDLRVSADYLDSLNRKVESAVREHVRRNGSKRTLRADVFLLGD